MIGSTSLPTGFLDRAFLALEGAAKTIADLQGADTIFSRSRGDGWQLVVIQLQIGIRAALICQAALRSEDRLLSSRIGLAEGNADLSGISNLNSAIGEVFIRSGRSLDEVSGPSRMRHDAGGAIDAVMRLSDRLAQGWTQVQATAAFHLLNPSRPTRKKVSEGLGVSRQAVDKTAHSAHLPTIEDALELIEHKVQ